MLAKLYRELDAQCVPQLRKTVLENRNAGNTSPEKLLWRDASRRGAFPFGAEIRFDLTVPRMLGCLGVVMRLARDGEEPRNLKMTRSETSPGEERYSLTLRTEELCGEEESGLLYYEFLFLRGTFTLFSHSSNNVDFTLCEQSAEKFRLLVYEKDFCTPDWFPGGVMYHVFVDRFCRGAGPVSSRMDAELEEDWEHGMPQFAARPGDPLANNRFFGGNLWGVAEKLDYLSAMGVTVLYLSPVFRAYSNHKYDTGDYEEIDGMFGGEAAFRRLLEQAKQKGIRVVLDGVFNHTGDDSRYFNRYGKYPGTGAYQSEDSPYHDWYVFREFPEEYEAWWGISILPKLNPGSVACRKYFTGENGIVEKYLKMGISGWRLDVADELSDEFLDELRVRARSVNPQALVLGEVWENAADKIAYGKRRRYFSGRQLDSVMNYPLRNGIVSFVRDGDADALYHALTELYGSYPPSVCNCLMNLLGTHDTERILTVLGASREDFQGSNEELSRRRLSAESRRHAVKLLKIASAIQYTVFGVPSVYYGDEAGMEGYHDPFCRMPYPWGREDGELREHYRRLGQIRRHKVFQDGEFRFLAKGDRWIAYERILGEERVLIGANVGDTTVCLQEAGEFTELLTGERTASLTVPPEAVCIWKPVR